jgi:hypothetical protein
MISVSILMLMAIIYVFGQPVIVNINAITGCFTSNLRSFVGKCFVKIDHFIYGNIHRQLFGGENQLLIAQKPHEFSIFAANEK